ncbi:unnamed protein product [Orchesella dallaii]|uniref:MACPF domain-containing protein n=1 Tax=Orchesella dallaii TaxID=48710 RepID=A0ABP1S586_9HEXA
MSSPPVFTIDEYVRVSSCSESDYDEYEDEDDGVPVELPANCSELMQLYRADSKKCKNLYGLIKNGLNYGRSFNSIILLVYGESHAGKSMTINKLFNDPNLCPINPFKSETHDMIIYQKKILVKDSHPSVYGYLRFIDTPGTFDSEGKDEENMKLLNAFRKQSPLLSCSDRNQGLKKTLTWGTKIKIRSKVYPNVVLFFVSADGKTQGNRTRLRSSLQVLKETGFVDIKYQNLIVVVTRAAQLIEFGDEEDSELEKTSFLINSSKLEMIIRDAVQEVLGIDASVVFVENKPQRLLKKPENSDYYMLPDGKFSHHNLLDAIINCFQKREFNDILGKLLMGCYLDPSCPERSPTQHPIERKIFTPSHTEQNLVETEIAMEAINLSDALPSFTEINNDLHEPKFVFEYLGHGICQCGNDIKSTSLLGKKEYQKFGVGNKQFRISAELEIIPKKSTSINLYKLDSLINETNGSNLSFGAKLILPMMRTFNLNFDKGATRNESNTGAEVYVYQFEKILSLVKHDEPENIIENCCSTFKNQFLKLTADEIVNDNDFPSFFERWGTHFITQQAVGGGIYIFYTFCKQMTAENKAGLEAEFGALFNGIEGNASYKAGETINNLRKRGVQNERILILGGSLEASVLNFESLMKDKDILTRWNQSIENEPASLVSETTFFP